MAILVLIDGVRFLVDVGCGVQSPVMPLPLRSGTTATGLAGQTLKVEHKKLAPTAMGQPVWIYSMRFDGGEEVEAPWKEMYAFADADFLPSDFDVLNYYTLHASPFTRMVVVQSFVFDGADGSGSASKTVSLVNDRLTQNVRGEDELVATLTSERERVEAFEKYFGIKLSQDEVDAMHGSAYALALPA